MAGPEPVGPAPVADLLAPEPGGRELLVVADERLGDEGERPAGADEPRAPVAVLARRERVALVERDGGADLGAAGEVAGGGEPHPARGVDRRLGQVRRDRLRGRGDDAAGAAVAGRAGGGVGAGGVRSGAQAGGERGGPAGHGLAVVVGEADDRGPRRRHAGVAGGGGAAAGSRAPAGPAERRPRRRRRRRRRARRRRRRRSPARARSGARARRGRWRGGRGGRGSGRPPRPGEHQPVRHRNTPQPATATAPASDAAGSRQPGAAGDCQYPDPGRDGRSGEHGGRRADRSPCGHGRYRRDREGDGARRRGRQGRPGAQPQRRGLQR